MKNLGDLNNILFQQLDRLSAKDLRGEELQEELERAKAIKEISTQIISNANTALRAEEFKAEVLGRSKIVVPKMLEG